MRFPACAVLASCAPLLHTLRMSSEEPSAGKRLGRMMAAEPELTEVATDDASREFCRRFVDYVTAGGFSVADMVTRMERLKFETIVTGKSYREVLDEA